MPRHHATYDGPNVVQVALSAIRDYAPTAASLLQRTAKEKIGSYQHGWPMLAESTRRRKRRAARGRAAKINKQFAHMSFAWPVGGGGSDQPLLFTGKMGSGINATHRSTAFGASISLSGPTPLEYHEQDPEMGVNEFEHTPKRPVLGPTVEYREPEIVSGLETIIASRF